MTDCYGDLFILTHTGLTFSTHVQALCGTTAMAGLGKGSKANDHRSANQLCAVCGPSAGGPLQERALVG